MRQAASVRRILHRSAALSCLALTVLWTNPSASATGGAASALDEIRERGILVAGISRNTPPFAQQGGDGEPRGFDVDLIDGLAARLGVQVRYVPLSGAARIAAVQAGRVHLTAATLTATAERRRLVDFSSTYFHDSRRILVRNDSAIAGAEDLAGQQVGVAGGATGRALLGLAPAAIPVTFASCREALPALLAGRIDAIAAEASILQGLLGLLASPDSLRIVGDTFSRQSYSLALPKDDPRWHQQVNSYLRAIEDEGSWEIMARRWFGERGPLPYPDGFHPVAGESR